LINELQKKYDLVVATQDWHPSNHQSFASQHEGKKATQAIFADNLEEIKKTFIKMGGEIA